ncbi:MAG: GAF domain-containing protein [Verrucomicrobiota bacterium]
MPAVSSEHSGLTKAERLLRGTVEAGRRMLAARDLESGFKAVLESLRDAMEQTRVVLIRYDADEGAGHLVDEALFPGCPSLFEIDPGPYHDHDYEEAWVPLKRGEIYSSATAIKTGANQELNAQAGTGIDLMVPIFVEQRFWGHICFDRIGGEHPFSEAEIDVLRGAVAVLAGAIEKEGREAETRLELRRRDTLNSALVQCTTLLLEGSDFYGSLEKAVDSLREAAGVQGVKLIQLLDPDPETGEWELISEAVAEGHPRQKHSSIARGSNVLVTKPLLRFLEGADWQEGSPSSFECELYDRASEELNILYSICFRICIEERLWGVLALDDCLSDRRRSDSEKQVLMAAARAFGLAIDRFQKRQKVLETEQDRAEIAEKAQATEEKRRRLLEAVTEVSDQLLAASSWRGDADEIAGKIGVVLGVDRVCLTRHLPPDEVSELGYLEIFTEWNGPGILRQTDDPELRVFDMTPYARYFEEVQQGRPCQVVTEAFETEEMQAEQAASHSKSQFQYPIMVDGELWGTIGVDDCTEPRQWPEEEIATLQVLASAFANVITREALEQAALEQLKSKNRELSRRQTLLEAVTEVSDQLLAASSWREYADEIAAKVGLVLGVDRVCFGRFLPPDEAKRLGYLEIMVEWTRPPLERQMDTPHLQLIDLDSYADYFAEVSQGRSWQKHTNDLLTEAAKQEQEATGARSQFHYAIMVDGMFWGSIGVDDCIKLHQWPEEEIATLQVLASAFANVIKREQLTQERLEAERSRADAASAFGRELARRNDLLNAVVETSELLLGAQSLDEVMETILARIGAAMGADRCCLGQYSGPKANNRMGYLTFTHEWAAPGIPRQTDNPAYRTFDMDKYQDFHQPLLRGELVGIKTAEIVDPVARQEQEANGIQSQFAFPIMVDDVLWGCFGTDDCRQAREWSEEEIATLRVVASSLASVVKRERLTQERLEIERSRAEENAKIAGLLSSVAGGSRELLNAEEFELALNDWLAAVGPETDADSIAFYRKIVHSESGMETFEFSAQWWRPGKGQPLEVSFASPEIIDPRGTEAEIARMLSGKCAPVHTEDLTPGSPGRLQLEAQGTETVIHAPILLDGNVWGLIGFDYTRRQEPSKTALAVLQTTADSLAAVIQRNRVEERLLEEQRLRADENAGHVSLLQEILIASRELLNGGDFDQQLEHWLGRLGLSCGAHLSSYGVIERDPQTGELEKIYPVAGWVDPAYKNMAWNGDGIPLTDQFMDWAQRLMRGETIWANYSDLQEPASQAYWDDIGCRSTLLVPVDTLGPNVGWLCFDFVEERPESPIQVSAIQTAAESLGAAIRQDTAQKSLLEEQQDRADENAQHVNLLQGILSASRELFEGEDFDQQLDLWLERLGSSCGAHAAIYGLIETNADAEACEKNYVVTGWVDPSFPRQIFKGEGAPLSEEILEWTNRLMRGDYIWANYSDLRDPLTREYWDKVGCRCCVLVPVNVTGPHIGWLCFDFLEERPENPVQLSAIIAASESLGAAIRQNAAQERLLEAERQRLEELARTNSALASGMQALSKSTTIDRVVDGITELMAKTLGGEAGAVFLIEREEGRLSQYDNFKENKEDSKSAEMVDISLDNFPAWERIIQNPEPTLMHLSAPGHDGIHPDSVAYMQDRHLKWLVNLPLLIEGRLRWLLAVWGRGESQLTEDNLSLFKTLSHQLKLTLELKRLGDESSEALVAEARAQAEYAVLEERAKLAGQIHDTLAQGFTGTMLHLEALTVRLRREETVSPEELERVRKIAAFGLSEARRTAVTMRPLKLDGRSFQTALKQLVERSCIPDLLDCHVEVLGKVRKLPDAIEEMFLCIAHEAVNNAIRHAEASLIEINLEYQRRSVVLVISDNGEGFEIPTTKNSDHSFGLNGMSERAAQNSAEVRVESTISEGTKVTVEWRETQ